jgi:HlyD family secretion protein/adhesin transport system membrane fusion protein
MSDSKTYRFLLILVIAFLSVFFLWAGQTEIDQQVRGTGKIIPAGKARKIQHLESAIVDEIFITEGQVVRVGDPLFQLANTKAEADMQEISISLDALRIKKQRLQAELNNESVASLRRQLSSKNKILINSELNLFEARKIEFDQKLDGLKKRMKQKALKLNELQSNVTNLKTEREISQEQLKIKRELRRKGAISRSQYLDVEGTVKNFNTRIAKVESEIPITKTEISEVINLLEETKQGWRSDVIEQLGKTDVDIKQLTQRITTFSDAVSRTEIQSPINGIVNKINFNTRGGVVQSGQILAELIPIEEVLLVEGKIALQDRGKIWVGQKAAAKITAYDYSIYGSIDGEITNISADSFSDNQGGEYYQIRVTLSKENISEDFLIFPGMSVELNVMANKISILKSILRPFLKIRENALREV